MLFGYDVGFSFESGKGTQKPMTNFRKGGFQPSNAPRYENDSQNRESRQWNRDNRK